MLWALASLALAIGMATCDNAVKPDENQLTAEEAEALFVAANTLTFDSTTLIAGTKDEFRCPQGGQAKVVVNVKDGDNKNKMIFDWTVTPAGCRNSSGDLTFTMDGYPSTKTDMVFDLLATDCPDGSDFCTTVESAYSGDLKWQLKERSGKCAIDVKLEAYVDGSDPQNPRMKGVAKGSACERQIEVPASKLVKVGLPQA